MSTVQLIDDDCPRVPNPADDSLSSPQSRRYYKEQLPPPSKRSFELLAVGHPKARCLSSLWLSKQWTDRDSQMELMTISQAARRLGYKSRSQLYRLLNDGYLHEHVHVQQHTGQRLVDVDGLREKLQCICQWRPDSVFLRR